MSDLNRGVEILQVHGDRVYIELDPSTDGVFKVQNPTGVVKSVGYGELSKNIKVGDRVVLEKEHMLKTVKVLGGTFTVVRSADIIATIR